MVGVRPARVEARGWGWRHTGRRAWALDGLDLVIEPGERVLLLGASGSGKSTMLAGLAGVLGADSDVPAEDGEQHGALLLDGVPALRARGRAGLVLQDPESQMIMARVGDDVAFSCENLGVPRDEIWRRVDASLDAVGLRLQRDHPTERLSGGQKQRLALAGALAMQPGLLLLDEPTAQLDPAGVLEVRDAVAALVEATGTTLVVVEHRVDVWQRLVNRVVVLDGSGHIVADGDPDVVLTRSGRELAAQGVWVPGLEPVPVPRMRLAGEALLSATDLAIARRRGLIVRGGIEMSLAAGEPLAMTGSNGSGKSTLALTLAGLLPPAAGEVRAQPALASAARPSVGSDPLRWRSRELLPRIGTVFQAPEHQLLARTVRDELAIGPRALGLDRRAVDARVDELLDKLGLTALAAANPFSLSGGQARRLSVGTALATAPRVLVLDEPTFGQDANTWRALVALLDAALGDGTGVVFATHDERLAPALGARELLLDRASG